MRSRFQTRPHPHLVLDEILPSSDYRSLRWPEESIDASAICGLTAADARYAAVLADPGWRALHDLLRGETFVRSVLRAFADDMRREGCLVDAARARLTDYVETRDEKERSTLDPTADPNELFTRLDFQSKALGAYRDFVHLDWPRRIVGGILFFSDADEEGLLGGETAFFRDRGFANDRWCHEPELVASFRPRHNTGVIFLNANAAFHGPRRIEALRGRRRWLYYAISSRRDVWPCAPRRDRTTAAHEVRAVP